MTNSPNDSADGSKFPNQPLRNDDNFGLRFTEEKLQEALRPIASLMSKSEKAMEKLAAGTWQHTMLQANLKALRIASALMNKEAADKERFTRDDLQDALRALAEMITKTEKAQPKFPVG